MEGGRFKHRRFEEAVQSVLFAMVKDNDPPGILNYICLFIEDIQLLSFSWIHQFGFTPLPELFSFEYAGPEGDYPAWNALFWAFFSLVALTMAAAFYIGVSYNRGKFDSTIPVRILRLTSLLISTLLLMPILSSFFQAFICEKDDEGEYSMTHFEGIKCFSGSHLPVLILSIIGAVVMILYAIVMSSICFEPDPRSHMPNAKPHGRTDTAYVIVRVILTAVYEFCSEDRTGNSVKLAVGFILISGLCCMVLVYQPFYSPRMTDTRAGFFFAGLGSMVVAIGTFAADGDGKAAFGMLVALTPVFFAFGFYLSGVARRRITRGIYSRLAVAPPVRMLSRHASHFNKRDMAGYAATGDTPTAKGRWTLAGIEQITAHKTKVTAPVFNRITDVEIAARFLRTNRDPDAILLAHDLFAIALQEFPHSPLLRIIHARYIGGYSGQATAARKQLEAAMAMKPGFDIRCLLFMEWRTLQQEKHTEAELGIDKQLSITSYIQFQMTQAGARRHHIESMRLALLFWRAANCPVVDPDVIFFHLYDLSASRKKAQYHYEQLLSNYPKSKTNLRLYAHFLTHVCNEPDKAQDFTTAAGLIEDEEMRKTVARSRMMQVKHEEDGEGDGDFKMDVSDDDESGGDSCDPYESGSDQNNNNNNTNNNSNSNYNSNTNDDDIGRGVDKLRRPSVQSGVRYRKSPQGSVDMDLGGAAGGVGVGNDTQLTVAVLESDAVAMDDGVGGAGHAAYSDRARDIHGNNHGSNSSDGDSDEESAGFKVAITDVDAEPSSVNPIFTGGDELEFGRLPLRNGSGGEARRPSVAFEMPGGSRRPSVAFEMLGEARRPSIAFERSAEGRRPSAVAFEMKYLGPDKIIGDTEDQRSTVSFTASKRAVPDVRVNLEDNQTYEPEPIVPIERLQQHVKGDAGGGGGGNGGKARSSASFASSSSRSSSSQRLRKQRIETRLTRPATRERVKGIVMWLALVGLIVAGYLVSLNTFDEQTTRLDGLKTGTRPRRILVSTFLNTRELVRSVGLGDTATYAKMAAALVTDIDRYETIGVQQYMIDTDTKVPRVKVTRQILPSEPQAMEMMTALDAMLLLMKNARIVAATPFSVANSTNLLWNPAVRFVLDNGLAINVAVDEEMNDLELNFDRASKRTDQINYILMAIFLLIDVGIIAVVFWPLWKGVMERRTRMAAVLMLIPRGQINETVNTLDEELQSLLLMVPEDAEQTGLVANADASESAEGMYAQQQQAALFGAEGAPALSLNPGVAGESIEKSTIRKSKIRIWMRLVGLVVVVGAFAVGMYAVTFEQTNNSNRMARLLNLSNSRRYRAEGVTALANELVAGDNTTWMPLEARAVMLDWINTLDRIHRDCLLGKAATPSTFDVPGLYPELTGGNVCHVNAGCDSRKYDPSMGITKDLAFLPLNRLIQHFLDTARTYAHSAGPYAYSDPPRNVLAFLTSDIRDGLNNTDFIILNSVANSIGSSRTVMTVMFGFTLAALVVLLIWGVVVTTLRFEREMTQCVRLFFDLPLSVLLSVPQLRRFIESGGNLEKKY